MTGDIKEKLDITSVKWIDEVLAVAVTVTHMPTPIAAPADPAKPAEVIAGEKRARKPGRAK